MVNTLVDDAKSWLLRSAFLVQRHDLHDITVADSDRRCMRQRTDVRSAWVIPRHEWYHLQDVVVKHQSNELASLAQEDWVGWIFLVVQHLLADVAT